MKAPSHFFSGRVGLATMLALAVAACSSADTRAQQAFGEYQAAAASGDMEEARLALLRLVAAQDDVPDYWAELAKVQLQLGAYGDAYYALTRAHELDRSNVEILSSLTQLATLSGNMETAEKKARLLELLSPDHPAVDLAYASVELRRQNVDVAERHVDAMLSKVPFDPFAKVLKARILVARGQTDQAVALLEAQIRSRPDDVSSLKALARLHERFGRWEGVAAAASQLVRINPSDKDSALLRIEAAFRSGDVSAARRASLLLLAPTAPPDHVDAVLSLWAEYWRSPEALNEARRLARQAGPVQLTAYATYFNEAGSPQDAAALLGPPQLPVTVANSSVNALIAESMALRGRTAEAKRIFDAILQIEPDHVYALRGRIRLGIGSGQAKAAIRDAQRLISVEPNSARHRLLLAKAYEAAGDRRQVDRTLWAAFHDIPGNRRVYDALFSHVRRTGGPEAAGAVTAEFEQQRASKFNREFV